MCLTIHPMHQDKTQTGFAFYKPKKAEKDIVCYKALKKTYNAYNNDKVAKSILFNFYWQKNKVKEEPLAVLSSGKLTQQVYKGFHGFLKKEAKFKYFTRELLTSSVSNNTTDTTGYSTPVQECMNAKMIIPKGARYYLGVEGDIVANKMKLVEFIS